MKLRMYFVFLFGLLLICCILSCEEEGFPVTLEIGQAERLLTADSNKVWLPVESSAFSACEVDNQFRFSIPEKKNKLGSFSMNQGQVLCPETESAEVKGSWEIDTLGSINRLIIYAIDTNTYQIDLITASKLQLSTEDQTVKAFVAAP